MTTESFKRMLQDALKDWHDESWKAEGAMLALNQVLHRVEIEEKWQNEEAQTYSVQEDHENTESNIAKTTDTANRVKLRDNPHNRERRPMMKTIIVDGTGYSFKNAKEMLRTFGIMDYYKTFCHLVQYKGGRKNLVKMEADALRRLLVHQGKHLDSYTAHGFNGFAKTIMFDNETEKENA